MWQPASWALTLHKDTTCSVSHTYRHLVASPLCRNSASPELWEHTHGSHTHLKWHRNEVYITHCQCFSFVQIVHSLLSGVCPLTELQAEKETREVCCLCSYQVMDNEGVLGRQVEGRESPSGDDKWVFYAL